MEDSSSMEHSGHSHDLPLSTWDTSPVTDEPIGSILWLHLLGMSTAFGLIFPVGMILGLTRSRWHVPVQVFGSLVVLAGFFLGHTHSGRNYEPHNAHRHFAWFVVWALVSQVAMGAYLKLHWERWGNGWLRRWIVPLHKIVGIAIPVIGYVQMVLGVIASVGFCYGDETGQCLAHFIMGSSFVAYGIIMIIMLRVGGGWLKRRGQSQEWFDSWVIMIWGIINTFTEHRWGSSWNHGDYQHTSMGILWWAGGALGIFLSRHNTRNVVPSLVILFTGVAMVGHQQHVPNSGPIHSFFGYTLVAGAVCRIIEICFVWTPEATSINPFQHLPSLLIIMAGFLFMSATEEQIMVLNDKMIDPASWANVILSIGFLVFLYAHVLLSLWETSGTRPGNHQLKDHGFPLVNGVDYTPLNGHTGSRDRVEMSNLELADHGDMLDVSDDEHEEDGFLKSKTYTSPS
ncbi:hypothetical protein BZG36_03843 [Bifiguratus adelaidae]|uniref:Cytochrome b561 domain-containing protein n=1 Tax=Bifiguratus adelaidae TaxID=1938954 RepID=A0A261XWC9_9FUNG|nr:hypothetical protein BZG36_03843 [Bifiguratus adelaidae]